MGWLEEQSSSSGMGYVKVNPFYSCKGRCIFVCIGSWHWGGKKPQHQQLNG